MRRFILGGLLALASVAIAIPAQAAAPVASLGTGPGTYTVNVTADHGSFAISQALTRNPVTSGGCANSFRRKPNGQYVYLGTACSGAGTIQFSTSLYVACETPLSLSQDGVVLQSWSLNSPCPPPAPPAIVVTYGDGIASFDNTAAAVDQQTVFSVGVPYHPSCDTSDPLCVPVPVPPTSCTTASTDPTWAGATLTQHIAASGPNHYVYYTLDGVDYVHVPAGQTAYVAWTCS